MLILVYLLILFGFLILSYYLLISIVGKIVAKKIKTKDRFIWNFLKCDAKDDFKFNNKRVTFIATDNNLLITDKSLLNIYLDLKKTESLENFEIIDFKNISKFEYYSKEEEKTMFLQILTNMVYRLLKINNYVLKMEYIDSFDQVNILSFKSMGLTLNDFKSTFIDFDHQIYKNRTLVKSEPTQSMKNIVEQKEEILEFDEDKTVKTKN